MIPFVVGAKIARPAACPLCHEQHAVDVLLPLHEVGHDKAGKVVSELAGFKLQCQKCAAIFNVDRLGKFVPHPATRGMQAMPRPQMPQAMPNGREPEPAGLPMPRRGPVV